MPKNPLQKLIAVAKINSEIWKSFSSESCTLLDNEINEKLICKTFNTEIDTVDKKAGYERIELAAIALFFQKILDSKNETVVFENTLGRSVRGIDTITKTDAGKYTFYEIKGTTKPLKNPASYLINTKTKGKQLSLRWCWSSLVDFAEYPSTADVFLHFYEEFLNLRIDRKVAIVECELLRDGSYIGGEIHYFDVGELAIDEDYDLSRFQKMAMGVD